MYILSGEKPLLMAHTSAYTNHFLLREDDEEYSCMQLHASCWNIFERLQLNLDIPVIYRLAKSFLQDCTLIDWGHHYGGDLPFDHPRRVTEERLAGSVRAGESIFMGEVG